MKNYTCNDCYFFDTNNGTDLCDRVGLEVDNDNEICPDFMTGELKRPNFCKLANSVDEMAKALVRDNGTDFICVPTGFYDIDYEKVLEKAREWLMEIEE